MKLLYPEIDTWVYNMQKTDPSINTLPMSITRGDAGDGWGCVPPAQKAATTYERGQNAVCLCHFGRSDWSADFHFKAFTLAEATKHKFPVTSSQRRDYFPALHALSKIFSTLQLPRVHNTSHPKLFPLEYFHFFKWELWEKFSSLLSSRGNSSS